MDCPPVHYFLIVAILLLTAGGVVLYVKLHQWRRRCHKVTVNFLEREQELQLEIDNLRERFDSISRENRLTEGEGEGTRPSGSDGLVDNETTPAPYHNGGASLPNNNGGASLPNNNVGASQLYKRFIGVVEEELGNSGLQIDEIGQRLNLSRIQLYRRLKSETGMTPNELLRTYRLTKASKMLTSTDLTIAEIAYRVGFSSPSYFSRCFKEQFGTIPQDLRNTSRK